MFSFVVRLFETNSTELAAALPGHKNLIKARLLQQHDESRTTFWHELVQQAEAVDTVEILAGHFRSLARARDGHDRDALTLAVEETRRAIVQVTCFGGRYELSDNVLHRSFTSIVLRATDMKSRRNVSEREVVIKFSASSAPRSSRHSTVDTRRLLLVTTHSPMLIRDRGR